MKGQRRWGHGAWARPTNILAAAIMVAAAGCSDAPAGEVRFLTPTDGQAVTSPVSVEMAASDFVLEPAANGVKEGHGHLHIMIDAPCVPARHTVPPSDQHLHFGRAQTTATLELSPGEHFLCLQAADGNHTALAITDEITITVAP